MSYVAYKGLKKPDDILEKMAEYIVSMGYAVVQDITGDVDVFAGTQSDGNRFVFKDVTDEYFIILRSANGINPFGFTDDATMDICMSNDDMDSCYTGIAFTVSDGYSRQSRWYNQFNAPVAKDNSDISLTIGGTTNTYNLGKQVMCGWMPASIDGETPLTLYCNHITSPTDTLLFSLVKEDVSTRFYQCTHAIIGNLYKYDSWDGGIYFSASATQSNAKDAYRVYEDSNDVSDEYIMPILGCSENSNTFLRIDIDDAPTQLRGEILWAASGEDNITGKKLKTPIIGKGYSLAQSIPHYKNLQSDTRLDWGRNINTLNGITIDLPIFFSVQIDPDLLNLFAPVGVVSGVYFCCLLNMQTTKIYEKQYPKSGVQDQVFSFGRRRGAYGFDGIGVYQSEDASAFV